MEEIFRVLDIEEQINQSATIPSILQFGAQMTHLSSLRNKRTTEHLLVVFKL